MLALVELMSDFSFLLILMSTSTIIIARMYGWSRREYICKYNDRGLKEKRCIVGGHMINAWQFMLKV